MKGVAGGIVEKTMPIHQSNVAIFNAATGKADRVGIKLLADGKRVRVYKSSGEEIKAAVTMARFHEHYREKLVPELTAKFGYKSSMQVPRSDENHAQHGCE